MVKKVVSYQQDVVLLSDDTPLAVTQEDLLVLAWTNNNNILTFSLQKSFA